MDIDTENELERLLTLAYDEPAHRPEFYQLLPESTAMWSAGQRTTEIIPNVA